MKRVAAFFIVFIVLVAALIVYLGISRHEDTSHLFLSGVVEASEYDLAFRTPGRLEAIYFDEGDLIDSGAVAAELERTELEKVLSQAEKTYEAGKAGIKQLEVSLETVNRNLSKVESLIPAGAATQNQYDDLFDQKRQVESQLNYSRKNVEAAKAAVELSQVRLEYATLSSTLSGTVLNRMYEPGEVIMTGSPVLTVADLENLEIRVYVPETSLGKIKLGQDVSIMIDSHPDRKFPGKIATISDKAEFTPKNVQTKEERVKQVFAVDIEASSAGGILKPGMPCDVIIAVE